MNGENRPIGPAPLPDNSPPRPPGGAPPPPPPGGPPPPPPPQIDIRTMASDAESLKASGGLGTEPKTFSPADLAKEPVFASEIVSPAGAAVKAGGSGKKLGVALGAVAILALAAAAGYFFIWPLFSGSEEQVTETTPPPALPTPTPPPAPTHQGYFKTAPAGGTKQVTLGSLTAVSLASSLKASSGEATSTGLMKEVVLNVNGNASVAASSVLSVLFPGSGLEAYMEGDVTAFVYYANGKSYPGYVFKLKSGADVKAAETAAAKIETSANLAALYPDNPGTPKGGWKDGNVSGVKTRYLLYSSAGASVNYGWAGNYLVISTSYDGFKKAVDLLK